MLESKIDEITSREIPSLCFIIPVFNDWKCATLLLTNLDYISTELNYSTTVIFVDDGSTDPVPTEVHSTLLPFSKIEVLHLRRNVGHQRAIALGLSYVNETYHPQIVVVMDSDGEDSPNEVKTLVAKCVEHNFSKIIFAKRRKRTDGLVFIASYNSYKLLHYLLTGKGINIGNFSAIPGALLPKVVGISELWNHYAAGIVHARLPIDTIPIDKAARLEGRSKMNFVSLVTHGLSAISVYGDIVGVRLLCLASLLNVVVVAALVSVLFVRLFTNLAIPGWATTAFGILAIVFLNLITITGLFVLFTLNARASVGFLPVRDWKYYVASRLTLFER
jgi:glycosyltransferase involved in cell wall biosynthesis